MEPGTSKDSSMSTSVPQHLQSSTMKINFQWEHVLLSTRGHKTTPSGSQDCTPSAYLCVFLSTSHCEPSVLGSSLVLSPFSWGPKLYPKAAPPHLRPIHNTLRTVLAHTMNHHNTAGTTLLPQKLPFPPHWLRPGPPGVRQSKTKGVTLLLSYVPS
jgi:hypothetical protein